MLCFPESQRCSCRLRFLNAVRSISDENACLAASPTLITDSQLLASECREVSGSPVGRRFRSLVHGLWRHAAVSLYLVMRSLTLYQHLGIWREAPKCFNLVADRKQLPLCKRNAWPVHRTAEGLPTWKSRSGGFQGAGELHQTPPPMLILVSFPSVHVSETETASV